MRFVLARRFIFLFILICVTSYSHAQNPGKMSPSLLEMLGKGKTSVPVRLMVRGHSMPLLLSGPTYITKKVIDYDTVSFHMIHVDLQELIDFILPDPNVLYADDGSRFAKEEVMVNNLDLSVNLISTSHNKFPGWNGDGLTFSLKENKPDTKDTDFAGRYISTPLTSIIVSQHATNMATMVAGGGNSWHLGKGAAWGASITSSDFANLLPDATSTLRQFNISVQNHSYGVGVENFYGADAGLYDASVNTGNLLHIFSSGNSGTVASATGAYAGVAGFANLTGSFKMAKNIITVGATDSFHNVVAQSSKGPAYDGRVKPELVAFGIDGSSGAAALTSGVALMMQQAYKQLIGILPENALIKAILINSAEDRGTKEVDFANGFGSLDALNAIRTISMGRFKQGNITNGSAQMFSIAVPVGIKKLKATLVWNDVPAAPNAMKALINDLDFELINSLSNERWLPWVLNTFPHVDSLRLPALRKRDSLNNVEQITVENPAAGNYELIVRGYNVNASTQNFFIAYQFDSSDIFEWHFPLAADPVFPAAINTLRWKSSHAITTGKLDYSTNSGSTWQNINPAINLASGFYKWTAPAFNGKILIRMQVNGIDFATDTLVTATRTRTGIGFNCPDSFLFYWNRIPEATAYKVYTLGSKYLEPILITAFDSFKVLQKSVYPSKYYAVAPLFNNREGVRSFTLDYTLQGVDCYIRSFFATLVNNNAAALRLSLGSTFNISKITLEKKVGDQFVAVDSRINIASQEIDFLDNNLTPGLNSYRMRIDIIGGGVAYTSVETVFYFDDAHYVVYPNPALQGEVIHIAQKNVDDALMQVFNSIGAKVYEKSLDDQINTIPPHTFSKGVHFIRVVNNNRQEKILKLIVY